jgi:hypothetical protein
MNHLRKQLEDAYNNFNCCTGYAYEAAIYDIEATNARIMAYIRGNEDAERKRLSRMQKNRRDYKKLLLDTTKRVFAVLTGRRIKEIFGEGEIYEGGIMPNTRAD